MISKYLGMVHSAEEQLAESFREVADRHYNEFEIRENCQQMAGWCKSHIEALSPVFKKLNETKSELPQMLRGSLFHGNRAGALGLLEDLQDLGTLAKAVHTHYIILKQGAAARKDTGLEKTFTDFGDQAFRQVEWITTQIKHRASQVLNVPPDVVSEAKASIPKKPNMAAIPEPIWGPSVSGILLLAVGLLSIVTGKPMLFPSLGPSAYLIAEMPAHPTARWYNTIVGHLTGLIVGFLIVALLNVGNHPALLSELSLTAGRMWAAVLATALTFLFAKLLHASHPPAAATTLLVALGSIKTINEALLLFIGAVILGLFGELLRRPRIGKMAVTKAKTHHPSPATNI
jgi:hypothetical protein